MSLRQCVSLLALASLLLLQLAAAEFDPAVCSENCRFVVVPSLGPAGPAGPAGRNGTDGKDGLNGTNGLDGLRGFNGTQGEKGEKGDVGPIGLQGVKGDTGSVGLQGAKGDAGSFDSSATYTGLKLQDAVVTGSINAPTDSSSLAIKSRTLVIQGAGIILPNPEMRFMGIDALDHYEIKTVRLTLSGGGAGSFDFIFTRIGRLVTMMLPVATWTQLSQISVDAQVESATDGFFIPPRFRPYGDMKFLIPGNFHLSQGWMCLELLSTRVLKFWGASCGTPLTVAAGSNGFYSTTVQWITP